MFAKYQGSRFEVWIKVIADPHDLARGFSILGREMRVIGYEPVQDTMEDLKGGRQEGTFWVVDYPEVYRVIPELKRFQIRKKPWFFPVEFCDSFVRPDYYLKTPIKDIKLE